MVIPNGIDIMLWVVVGIQALIIVALVYQLGDIRRRIEVSGGGIITNPLPVESDAPRFSALELVTKERLDSTVLRGVPSLLLFLSTDCTVCRKLARELRDVPLDERVRLVVYCNGAARGCDALLSSVGEVAVVLRKDQESVPGLFKLPGFPVAVMLDEHWRISGYRYPTRIEHIKEALLQLAAPNAKAQKSAGHELPLADPVH